MAQEYALYAVATESVAVYAVVNLRERPDPGAWAPVLFLSRCMEKPHARLLIIGPSGNVGSSAIAALTLYVTQYVVARRSGLR